MGDVLIPFLAGLLFGRDGLATCLVGAGLNPLFGGSAFRTLMEGKRMDVKVLIPFLAGLLFGQLFASTRPRDRGLNPLFGGSAFRTLNTPPPKAANTS